MNQKIKKVCAVTMMGTFLAGSVPIYQGLAASKNLKVSSKSITLTVGKTKAVTTNISATFKTSNKKIVSLKNVKKKKCTLVAKKKGSCTITVKAKNQKTIKVKVKVKKKAATTATVKPTATAKPVATVLPAATASILPTAVPQETETAQKSEIPQPTEVVEITKAPQETAVVIETEEPKETETVNETELPQQTEAPQETAIVKETEVPKENEEVKVTETPKETEEVKETEIPKETEEVKETEIPKETGGVKETDIPRETEEAKETEMPAETETVEETQIPNETPTVAPQETEIVNPTKAPVVTSAVIEAEDTDTIGGKVNNLGYNLSKVLPEEKDGNRMISSYSILMALTMLDNAAEGETKAEIEKVLGITDLSAWDEEFSIHLKNNCNDEIKDHETESEEEDERRWFRDSFFVPELSSANSLWYNDTRFSFDSEVQKEYMELLKDKFMAECRALDFSSSRNPVNDVNDWVAEKTNRKIQNILQGDLNPETAQAILVNTLYFNGCWKNIFNKELTSKAEFYGKEETTEVDMMRQVEENYSYYEEGGLRALELPFYGKNNLVMDVIIAEDNEQDVVSLYDKMSNTEKNRFYQALGNAEEKLVNMYLPKFKMEYGIGLDDYLRALGINQAFDSDGAEFPGLRGNNQENIYVDTVIHKSVIEVGEMGATAAAATVIGMAATSAMEPEDKPTPIEFKVDHPFVFTIRDKNTNMIYFMGQIENLSE